MGWKKLVKILEGPIPKFISFRTLEVDVDWKVVPCCKVTLEGNFELSELESICEELKRRLNANKVTGNIDRKVMQRDPRRE